MPEKHRQVERFLKNMRDRYNSFYVAACSLGDIKNPERVIINSFSRKISERSLFDLASVSKIIYSTALLRAMSQNNISFGAKIANFLPSFPNKDLNIHDLLSYRIYAEDTHKFSVLKSYLFHPYHSVGAKQLFSLIESMNAIRVSDRYSKYSNYPSWIVRLVLKQIVSTSPESYIIDNIFFPAKMFTARFAPVFSDNVVPGEKFRRKIKLTGWLSVDFKFKKGYPSDETAQAALLRAKAPLGHTGIFASLSDMEKFACFLSKSLLPSNPYKIFSDKIHKAMWNFDLTLKTDEVHKDIFFAGFRYKSIKDEMLSDAFSHHALLQPGFTGTFFALDFLHGRQVILLSNRTFPTRDLSQFVHGTDNSSRQMNKIRKTISRFAF